jgi:REP element-mobilizing transposase RayT
MAGTPTYPMRHSLRLKDYDYSRAGAYFLTTCTYDRQSLLSTIEEGQVRLTDLGKIVEEEWLRTEQMRRSVALDLHVIMPNHVHGILFLLPDAGKEEERERSTPFRAPSQTVGAIMRGFKSVTTSRIRKLPGHADLRVWQREYFDHVIRSEADLARIREYIVNNPAKWELDRYFLQPEPHEGG